MQEGRINLNIIKAVLLIMGIAIVLITLNAVTADQSDAEYVGTDECEMCHNTAYWNYKYDSWRNTPHGIDFATEWEYHGEPTNKYILYGGSCISCHVIGYNQTDRGGYDPAYAWNSTENEDLLGIGCENCHGPGSEHISSASSNDIDQIIDRFAGSCGGTDEAGCHGGARQYGNETIDGWSSSAHASGVPGYAQRLGCSHCMSTEGAIATFEGNPLTELPDEVTWSITCGACHDPHPDEGAEEHEAQLRVPPEEICDYCHRTSSEFGDESVHHPTKEMREGNAGIGVENMTYMPSVGCYECHMYNTPHGTPPAEAKQGHSWELHPEACVECHDGIIALPEYNVTESQEKIDELHANFTDIYNAVEPNIETMHDKKEFAEEYGMWTPELNNLYYTALWNFGLAEEDGSDGNHNPEYAEALMLAANASAMEIINAIPDEVTEIGIIPSSNTVNVGDDFTATIYIDPTEAIGGWQIGNFTFTQGLVNATEVTPGADWATFFDSGTIDNDTGTITNIQTFTNGSTPDTNHTACTISFTALAEGICTFEIVNVEISNESFAEIPVGRHTATVNIIIPYINTPPVITDENPENESTDVARPPAELSVLVEDADEDTMDIYIRWRQHDFYHVGEWVTLETYLGVGNGTYDFVPPAVNDWIWGDTTYTWSVNVFDGTDWVNETYTYTTSGSRYDVSNNDIVNYQDAGLVWTHRTSEVPYDGIYDVNNNGQVNFQDAGLTWINRD